MCPAKQRWTSEKREWKRSDTAKDGKPADNCKSLRGLFAGATGEYFRASDGTKKCPFHQSTNNNLQEWKRFKGMLEATLGAGTVSWRYVPTEANPADDITQGLCRAELSTGFRDNNGPKFLYESAELWPENEVKAPHEKDDVSDEKKGRWAGTGQRVVAKEQVNDLMLLNGKRKKVDVLQSFDLHVLNQAAAICEQYKS